MAMESFRYPSGNEMMVAEEYVNLPEVLASYGSSEWDELTEDGQTWIAVLVREIRAREDRWANIRERYHSALEIIARPFPDGCNWHDQARSCQVVAEYALRRDSLEGVE